MIVTHGRGRTSVEMHREHHQDLFYICLQIITYTVLKTREILPVDLRATYPENKVALTKVSSPD